MELTYGLPKQLMKWTEDNLTKLKTPVANASIYPDGDFIINMVGGPNVRSDFHDNPTEEIFYQLEGHAHLLIWDRGQFEKINLNPGDIFLLPAHLQHSPQRHEKGLCFLVERPRPLGEKDHCRWYCSECGGLIFDANDELQDLVADLPKLFKMFYDLDDSHRTCVQCGKVHPGRNATQWLTDVNHSKVSNFEYNFQGVTSV